MLPQPNKNFITKILMKVLGSSRLNKKTVIFNSNIKSKKNNIALRNFPFIQVSNQKTNDFATLARSKYHGR